MTNPRALPVLDGDERTFVSASQLTTFDSCARKWAFDKLDKVERAEGPGAIESSALHAECEGHHRGEPVRISPAAQVALRLAPPRGEGVLVEVGFEYALPSDTNIVFTGFIDVLDIRDPKNPAIWDYKFYRDLKYAKEEQDLVKDLQRIVYTHIIFEEFPEAEYVSFGLIQISKRAPHNYALVSDRWDRVRAKAAFENKAVSIANAIRGHRLYSSSALDIDPPLSDTPCGAFGGCPYIHRCVGRPEFSVESFAAQLFDPKNDETKDTTMPGYLSNFKKPAAPLASPAAKAPVAPAKAPVAPAKPVAKAPVAAPVATKAPVLKKFVAPAPPPTEPEPVVEEVVEEAPVEEEVLETTAEEVVEETAEAAEEVVEAGPPKKRPGRQPGAKDKAPRNAGVYKTNLLLTEIRDLLKYALIATGHLAEDADTTPTMEDDGGE